MNIGLCVWRDVRVRLPQLRALYWHEQTTVTVTLLMSFTQAFSIRCYAFVVDNPAMSVERREQV